MGRPGLAWSHGDGNSVVHHPFCKGSLRLSSGILNSFWKLGLRLCKGLQAMQQVSSRKEVSFEICCVRNIGLRLGLLMSAAYVIGPVFSTPVAILQSKPTMQSTQGAGRHHGYLSWVLISQSRSREADPSYQLPFLKATQCKQ